MSGSSQRSLHQTERPTRTVLIVGGAGYVGSNAAKALSEAGYTPIAFDNLSSGYRDFVKFGPFELGDLRDTEKLAQIFQRYNPVAVVHCATAKLKNIDATQTNALYNNIVLGTLSLLEVMRANAVNNLCVLTNASVYGAKSGLSIPEQTATEPLTPYGACLAAIENIIADFGTSAGLRWISLRLFGVGGADLGAGLGEGLADPEGLIPIAIDAALGRRGHVPILGSHFATRDGTALRDFVHVCDVADCIVLAIEHLLKGDCLGPYNVGTGVDHSVSEIIHMVQTVSGLKCPLRFEAKRTNEPFALSADWERARLELGWLPKRSSLDFVIKTAFEFRKKAWEPLPYENIMGGARGPGEFPIYNDPPINSQTTQLNHDLLLEQLDEFLSR